MGEDPYSKSRSFDEDYASGYKKRERSDVTQQVLPAAAMSKRAYSTDRSLNYGRRLYEHNMVCGPADTNSLFPSSAEKGANSFRNRSPLMMHFRPEQSVSNKRMVEPEELDENEQFYHLKKLLSNANLQNNKNYQYGKSKDKRNPLQSSESMVDSAARNRSPMLSKRAESMQGSQSQSSAVLKGRPVKSSDGRRVGNLLSNSSSSGAQPPPPVSSGRY